MFTERHYEKLAWMVYNMPNHAPLLVAKRETTAHALADMLEQDNSRFNREKFLKACGI